MKKGITFIAIAAMALAFVATADTDAKAWWGWHGMNLKIAGSSFSVTTLPDGTTNAVPPFTAIQNGIARGKYGKAQLRSQTFAGELAPAAEGECPDGLVLRGALTISFVLTYSDGSLISGTTTGDSHYCTDFTGTTFATDAAGIITGGARRFDDATGDWNVDATIEGSRLTGNLLVDLD
jgi:hypothetical protein